MSITAVFERVKSRDINWRRVFFVGVFVALFFEFAFNVFAIIPAGIFNLHNTYTLHCGNLAWSEALVTGAIDYNLHTGGIFGKDGFLTLNHYTEMNLDIKNFDAYLSHLGWQAIGFSIIGHIFSGLLNLSGIYALCRIVTAAFTSLIITLICYWLSEEFEFKNLLLAAIPMIVLCLAPTSYSLIGMARNLYWIPITLLLPFFVVFYLSRTKKQYRDSGFSIFALVLILLSVYINCVCRFEYLTAALVAGSVPIFYYAITERVKIKCFIIRFIQYCVAAISGFLLAFVSYIIALTVHFSSLDSAVNHALYDAFKHSNSATDALLDRLFDSVYMLPNYVLIGILCVISLGIIIPITVSKIRGNNVLKKWLSVYNRKLIGGIVASWISLIGPLAWYLIFTVHAQHILLQTSIVWFVPFIFVVVPVSLYFIMQILHIYGSWGYTVSSTPDFALSLIILPISVGYCNYYLLSAKWSVIPSVMEILVALWQYLHASIAYHFALTLSGILCIGCFLILQGLALGRKTHGAD